MISDKATCSFCGGSDWPSPHTTAGCARILKERLDAANAKVDEAGKVVSRLLDCHDAHRRTLEDKDLIGRAHLCHDRAPAAVFLQSLRETRKCATVTPSGRCEREPGHGGLCATSQQRPDRFCYCDPQRPNVLCAYCAVLSREPE